MNGYLYMQLRKAEREREMRRDLTEIGVTLALIGAALLVVAI